MRILHGCSFTEHRAPVSRHLSPLRCRRCPVGHPSRDARVVVGMNTTSTAVRVSPLPVHYPYPVQRLAKIVCQAAVHYFERGALPPLRKLILLQAAAFL
ncbi:MAG: hypothetical protein HY360_06840 [Verrucomicrobia bacterium]|nr:hypothetical protein [Verrucomicrobiota bacterium]